MELRTLAFDHPDAQRLIAEVQQVYVQRYGGEDSTPTDACEFAAPRGTFVVGYLDEVAVACGGWRVCEPGPDFAAGDAELKRMYVVPGLRGRGLSRVLLAELERRAVAAGVRRLVLETGVRQPEAIGLYVSSGYVPIPRFGMHRCASQSRCFAKVLPVTAGAGAASGGPGSGGPGSSR
ncbi:MAG TPA: GNAT family N-acetyltransferase [Pseudonocardiaceae bacterium]|nr:GNAT family N-acetyltransferase [Pseudonocardiaceae bacterium]